MPKIMLVGGSGKLGLELQKLRQFDYVPTHEEMDITDMASPLAYMLDKSIGLVVHCAAYTDVATAELDRLNCFKVNVTGTHALMSACQIMGAELLFISTEYAAHLTNYYAKTKRFAEQYANKSLRLLFKPTPWPYPEAYEDQYTSGDYVDVIAKEVDLAITLYDKLPNTTNIGTGRKSMYDLAKRTRPDVKPNSISESIVPLPSDCSMDLSKWEALKEAYAKNRSTETNL